MLLITTVPMLLVGIIIPSQPFVLLTNLSGWVNDVGIIVYPYPKPGKNSTYLPTALFVLITYNVNTSPDVIVVPVNLP